MVLVQSVVNWFQTFALGVKGNTGNEVESTLMDYLEASPEDQLAPVTCSTNMNVPISIVPIWIQKPDALQMVPLRSND